MKSFACFCFAVVVVSCTPVHPKAPQATIDICEKACHNLGPSVLNCEEGKPLANGTSCVDFCIETYVKGHDLQANCAILAKSCDEFASGCKAK